MNKRIYYNYSSILKNLAQYFPSRIVIILNSFFIIPLLIHFLNPKEISIYLISLQILNFVCTCSYDWISKAVLRFHDKYLLENRIQKFFSTTFWISVLLYPLILISFFIFKDFLISNFALNPIIISLIAILVIPCAIRQFLYQIMRINNSYKLYTFSIILYQILFAAICLILFKVWTSAIAIILAMIIAIQIIDIYIIRSINLKYPITKTFDKKIAGTILKYALPLVVTNWLYWAILNLSGLIFQSLGQYINTAIIGISRTFSQNIVVTLANLFVFVSFPVIMNSFEKNKAIKPYMTNLVRIYLFILVPIIADICFFSGELIPIILPPEYKMTAVILPLVSISAFSHELMKLINLKYHIKVSTWIELIPTALIFIISFILYLWGSEKQNSLVILSVIMVSADITLLIINLFINFKNFNFIKYSAILKTLLFLVLISFIAKEIVNFVCISLSPIISIFKIVLFLIISYATAYLFRNRILK